ncbi:MAG: hypothetical protein VKJ04_11010 [Vampirovibrionales bacterium]|nr:hypothetical protein [Vampirovibrionales bacterium]
MTSTQANLGELKQQLPHLREVTDEGWILQWGSAESEQDANAAPVFELLCPSASISTLAALDQRMSQAYDQARMLFISKS